MTRDEFLDRRDRCSAKMRQLLYVLMRWHADHPGDWADRRNLAAHVRQKRLSPHDVHCLDLLERFGLVVSKTRRSSSAVVSMVWLYMLHPDVAALVDSSEIPIPYHVQPDKQARIIPLHPAGAWRLGDGLEAAGDE